MVVMAMTVMAMAMYGHVCAASEALLAALSLGAFARSGQAVAERMAVPALVGTSTLVLACRDREKGRRS